MKSKPPLLVLKMTPGAALHTVATLSTSVRHGRKSSTRNSLHPSVDVTCTAVSSVCLTVVDNGSSMPGHRALAGQGRRSHFRHASRTTATTIMSLSSTLAKIHPQHVTLVRVAHRVPCPTKSSVLPQKLIPRLCKLSAL
jgi:hypothetical protein